MQVSAAAGVILGCLLDRWELLLRWSWLALLAGSSAADHPPDGWSSYGDVVLLGSCSCSTGDRCWWDSRWLLPGRLVRRRFALRPPRSRSRARRSPHARRARRRRGPSALPIGRGEHVERARRRGPRRRGRGLSRDLPAPLRYRRRAALRHFCGPLPVSGPTDALGYRRMPADPGTLRGQCLRANRQTGFAHVSTSASAARSRRAYGASRRAPYDGASPRARASSSSWFSAAQDDSTRALHHTQPPRLFSAVRRSS